MQLFADDSKYYTVLLFPVGIFLFANSSIAHLVVLSVFSLLFTAGIIPSSLGAYFKNYCNMLIMVVLFPLLIFQNLHCIV